MQHFWNFPNFNPTEPVFFADVDVGEIKSIVIEHDGLEERHSWFLEVCNRDRPILIL